MSDVNLKPITTNGYTVQSAINFKMSRHDFSTGTDTACPSTLSFGKTRLRFSDEAVPYNHTALEIQCCENVGHAGPHRADRGDWEPFTYEGQRIEEIATHRFTLTWDDEAVR